MFVCGGFNCINNNDPKPDLSTLSSSGKGRVDYIMTCLGKKIDDRTCGGVHRDWGNGGLKKNKTIIKMKKNLGRAILEHIDDFKDQNPWDRNNPYEGSKSTGGKRRWSFKSETGFGSAQGRRPSMQDAHFCVPLKGGTLVGVLDGHGPNVGGEKVAEFVKRRFPVVFSQLLDQSHGIVHEAMEQTCLFIQSEIILDQSLSICGSTAVICYLENKTNYVYTATIGDSEANIYRKVNNTYKSIPLSCLRNWDSSRDKARVKIALPEAVECWHDFNIHGKSRRVEHLNVSRSFGELVHNIKHPIDVVTIKPKLTICRMRVGDVLVLACDGLKDAVREDNIVNCIETNMNLGKSSEQIANSLLDLALASSQDNVTIVTVKIDKKKFFSR